MDTWFIILWHLITIPGTQAILDLNLSGQELQKLLFGMSLISFLANYPILHKGFPVFSGGLKWEH